MTNDRMGWIAVLVIIGACVVFFIGWNVGFNYGQEVICEQMAQPWEWRECY